MLDNAGQFQNLDLPIGVTLLTYRGHLAEINVVSWSPDGGRIVSASENGVVQVWDANTGITLMSHQNHIRAISVISWSPDGSRIIFGTKSILWIWNIYTGTILTIEHEHMNAVSWSPDGDRFASGSQNGIIQVWDAVTGAKLVSYQEHTEAVCSVAWSPDGDRIAAGSRNGIIQVWDTDTGILLLTYQKYYEDFIDVLSDDKEVESLGNGGPEVCAIAWSPDGNLIASGYGDACLFSEKEMLQIWDANTGSMLIGCLDFAHWVNNITWSPDGDRIAFIHQQQAHVLDISTRKVLVTYKDVNTVVWSPDSNRIASNTDTSVHIWDAAIGSPLLVYQGHTGGNARKIRWSPDGKYISSISSNWGAHVWDTTTGATLATLWDHSTKMEVVSWSPNGTRILSCSASNEIQVWDIVTGTTLLTCQSDIDTYWRILPVWSPDGNYIAFGFDEAIQIWDVATGTQLLTYNGHSEKINVIVWSPNDNRIASCSDATIQIWDATTGIQQLVYLKHSNNYIWAGNIDEQVTVDMLVWSPDGKYIASGSSGGEIYVWSTVTGTTITAYREYENYDGSQVRATWSPNGKYIASSAFDEVTNVWNVATGTLLRAYSELFAWSPNGKYTASVDDQTIQIRDSATGALLGIYRGHSGEVLALAWSPDSKRIASATATGQGIYIWQAT